ncbi:peptide chain release factor N(5)-glutamine methyltransferase [Brochothrix thermosphacta]|uniref:peptide chain release factor N(5)-glutamine methyltransferase n=1 Tax=Brochothrix thermosphacta TaxID=2756 RepID=UPI00265D051B|nr:peptide chain release factor N(5)-glutamine methyltransferase [Brochothrix thermosphacta]WKK69110.1 peptide chain release factor N(5)-glutamine methyltransferase [Brochothrix thermosphacta]
MTEWLAQAKATLQTAELELVISEVLMQRQMGWTKTQMVLSRHELVPTTVLAMLDEQLSRALAGEPVQYITGEEVFYDRVFSVSEAVLIPRPETEELVEHVLSVLKKFPDDARVVDVGTGSGAIAITLKKEQPTLRVFASDISVEALAVAEKNAQTLAAEITFVQGDLLQPLIDSGEKFEVVVSNPPYIAYSETDVMDVSVIEYEPHLALFAENDGLALYQRLIQQLPSCLKKGGVAAFEIGYHQGEVIKSALAEAYPQAKIAVVKDLSGNDRVVLMET